VFYGCTNLTGITIPTTVTSIGSQAFYSCHNLTNIDIPKSVESIGSGAFSNCYKLTSITVNEGNNYYVGIDGVLFNKEKTKLVIYPANKEGSSYSIPEGVTNLAYYAFQGCRNLESVTIPNTVTSIIGYAFQGCSRLKSVTIPNTVTSIGGSAFDGCSSLTEITIPEGVSEIQSHTFADCTNLEKIIIPEGVTSIGYCAFEGSGLKEVILPETLKTIGSYAFNLCYYLEKIELPETVESISFRAFSHCSTLKSITIPRNVNSIGSDCFRYCSKLTSIEILSDSATVGSNAFPTSNSTIYGWNNSTAETYAKNNSMNFVPFAELEYTYNEDGTAEVTGVADGVTLSGTYAIPSQIVNDGITYIVTSIGNSASGMGAFYGCSELTKITLPSTITTLEGFVFYGCNTLTDIEVVSENSSYSSVNGVLFNKNQKEIIKYPEGKADTSYIIPDTVTSIAYNAFRGCGNLTVIAIPEGVTTIGNGAFSECTSLTEITIPEEVTTIGVGTFKECSSLTEIKIPSNVTSIEDYAFIGCTNLTKANILNKNVTFGDEIFNFLDEVNEKLTIYGYRGSTAETYATANTIPFVAFTAEYKVEHYTEKLDGTYELNEEVVEGLVGEIGTQVSAENKIYEGFTYDNAVEGTILSGTVTEDENLILKLYYTRNSYELVYKVDGMQYEETESYKYEESVTIKEEPEKEGYTFSGWTGTVTEMPAADVEIVGTFAVNSYSLKINYVYKDGSKALEPYEVTINYGELYSIETQEIAGYTADVAVVEGTMGAEDIEVTVTYKANADTAYKVEHYLQNIENDEYTKLEEETDNLTGTTGEQTKATTKTYEGFTSQTVRQSVISGDGSTIIRIYYTRNSYTITFEEQGGTEVANIIAVYEGSITKPEDPSKKGYTFKGWYETAECTGKEYEFKTMPLNGVTLYAKWEIVNYTIEYNLAEGSLGEGKTNPTSYTVETESFTLENPSKQGYKFIGWTGANGEKPQTELVVDKGTTGNLKFVANWTEDTNVKYIEKTYIMNVDGITYKEEITEKYGTTGAEVEMKTEAPEGFSYDASQSNPKGTIAPDGSTVVEIYYTRNSYDLVYKVDGEQYGETESYRYEEKVTVKEEPVKEGYTFSGWAGTVTEMPAKAVELTGTFEINTYTIEYNLGEGSLGEGVTNPVTYTVETERFTLENPSKEGYTFIGWTGSNGEEAQTEVVVEKGTTGDKTFTANWKINSYNLKINYVYENGSVALDEYETTINYGEKYSKATPEIVGYKADKETVEGIMGAENLEVTVTYEIDETQTKTAGYTVEYYKDGIKVEEDSQTVEKEVHILENVVEVDKEQINLSNKYAGYKFDRTEPEEIPEEVAEGTTIKVYYVERQVESIAVTKEPDKTEYKAGENFEKAGMIVTATYDNGETKDLEEGEYKVEEVSPLTVNDTKVSIIYNQNQEIKTEVTIKVIPASGEENKEYQDNIDKIEKEQDEAKKEEIKEQIKEEQEDKIRQELEEKTEEELKEIIKDKIEQEVRNELAGATEEEIEEEVNKRLEEYIAGKTKEEIVEELLEEEINKKVEEELEKTKEELEKLEQETGKKIIATKQITYYEGLNLQDIELPENWVWKEADTKLYPNGEGEVHTVIYESQNENYENVEAGILVRVRKATPSYEMPEEIEAKKGQTLGEIASKLPARYSFMDELDTKVGEIGYREFKVKYTPEDTDKYEEVENIPVIIHVIERYIEVEEITLIEEIKLVEGGKVRLTADIVPEDATNKEVEWRSSNEGIVIVDGDGKVEAKGKGIAYIIVETKEGGKTASCRVEVIEKTYEVEETEETEEGIYISNINPNTTKEMLEEKFPSIYRKEIYNQKGERIEAGDNIGTGYTMNLYDGYTLKEEGIKLIVKGDVTGEGTGDCIDSAKIIYHRLGQEKLEGIYAKAADLNGDGEINGQDSTILIYHRLQMDGYEWEN